MPSASDEVAGYQLFKDSGCVGLPQRRRRRRHHLPEDGPVEPYQTDNPAEGRYAVTGKDADRFNFKVPTLRNVELTYPYFHDGAAWTLEEAVNTMGRIQLGKKFTPRRTPRSWPS
jgi:cytochrome c peroxidase